MGPKKMKLVPDHLYKRFMDFISGDTIDRKLESDRDEISKQQIPDDVKVHLYQNALRQIYDKESLDKKTPILVSSTGSTPVDSTVATTTNGGSHLVMTNDEIVKKFSPLIGSLRAPKILSYLLDNGMKINDKMEVCLTGPFIPGSDVIQLLKVLTNGRVKRAHTLGYAEIITWLRRISAPMELFPIGVRIDIYPKKSVSTPSPGVSTRIKWQRYKGTP
jgi:hypothetical protein